MTATAAAKPIADMLARTRAKADQRNAADAEAYEKLVRTAAEGNGDPEQIVKLLDRTGRDVDAFQRDVEALAERMLLKSQVDGATALLRERGEIESAIRGHAQALEAAIATAEAAFDAATAPLRAKHGALSAQIATAEAAEQKLRQTCPPDRRELVHAASRAAAAQRTVIERLETGLAEMKLQLPKLEKLHADHSAAILQLGKPEWPAQQQALGDHMKERDFTAGRIQDLKTTIARTERTELPKARADLDALQAEIESANEAMLSP